MNMLSYAINEERSVYLKSNVCLHVANRRVIIVEIVVVLKKETPSEN